MYGVFNHGLRKLPGLEEFLEGPVACCIWRAPTGISATAGWGNKASSRRAREVAAQRGVPFLRLEDGFLRSVGLGSQEAPLSVVIDDLGIYYDAGRPSRLEHLILQPRPEAALGRARSLMAAWRGGRVSKYNHAREELPAGQQLCASPQGGRKPYVLVVDQTMGDASIRDGLANPASFAMMLEAALDQHPDCTVVLKVHPDVFAGHKRGHFETLTGGAASRVLVLGADVHPVPLLEDAEAVYVVTSQMGFEALLWNKPVHTFGMPFYAGWGNTHDALPAPARRSPVALEALAYAALVDYPRYIDPETGLRCPVERVLQHLTLQRRMRQRYPAQLYAVAFSRWKKPIVRDFFQGSHVCFVNQRDQVPAGATQVVWGKKDEHASPGSAHPTIRLEDGFIRSVGLGAALVRPLSWVQDETGIYYDAGAPSGLEELLRQTVFDDALLVRAQGLQQSICRHGVTKYNVGDACWRRPPGTRRVILVPGQVESDASIRFGAAQVRRNIDLLTAVRSRNPDAYVIYKPHPDVRARLRDAGADEAQAYRWCDEVVGDIAFGQLLAQVDEVHVLTSLAGFEALMRSKKVTCYGQPFYSGWGLTDDVVRNPRRGRQLTLAQLVAATLILYPTYISRVSGKYTTAERALQELITWREQPEAQVPVLQALAARMLRKR
jgi:capsular polysaccharide export protein